MKSFKRAVQKRGSYVLDYSELCRSLGLPCWFIGKGRVAGNTAPIVAGLYKTPREAWKAAALTLGIKAMVQP